MKKNLFLILTALLIFWAFMMAGNGNYAEKMLPKAEAATTANVLLSGTVLQYLAITLNAGSTVNFSNITPGTPKCGDIGTQADVTTNASGGYTLGPFDLSDTDSVMVHSDGTTYIPDITGGTSTTPALWGAGWKGLGYTMYSGTQKNAKWGVVSTTYCDATHMYAKVAPQPSYDLPHTVTGYHAGADRSWWGWQIDVANTQKTGIYTGNVTFTSTAVL